MLPINRQVDIVCTMRFHTQSKYIWHGFPTQPGIIREAGNRARAKALGGGEQGSERHRKAGELAAPHNASFRQANPSVDA